MYANVYTVHSLYNGPPDLAKKAVIERDRYREFADHSHVINYNGDTI